MYQHILMPLENSRHDRVILDHVLPLAKQLGSKITLAHVADGWAARNYDQFNLRESDEMCADRGYLDAIAAELRAEGLEVETILARGEPANEILRLIGQTGCDLVAMTTHGHRFLADLVCGSTIAKVRHLAAVPLLVLRSMK